jgi:hypothetical protein
MAHSTQGLQLYSNFTDNKIGEAVVCRAVPFRETETYYEYADFVMFHKDFTTEYVTRYVKWRRPKPNYCFWQFDKIINNATTLVVIDFPHIMNGVYSFIDSVHRAKIGGRIVNNRLQPASFVLNVVVTRVDQPNGGYKLSVNNDQFVFDFNPDALDTRNSDEVDFEVE